VKLIESFVNHLQTQVSLGVQIGGILVVIASHGKDCRTFGSSLGEYIYLDTDIIDQFIIKPFHRVPKVFLANFCRYMMTNHFGDFWLSVLGMFFHKIPTILPSKFSVAMVFSEEDVGIMWENIPKTDSQKSPK